MFESDLLSLKVKAIQLFSNVSQISRTLQLFLVSEKVDEGFFSVS